MHITFMFASPFSCLNKPIKDEINFIDSVNEKYLTTQPTSQMPMKYAEHVDYSFTNEDKQFLNTESEGTCVIDNFIGLYGAELKMTREYFIKLHPSIVRFI